ncbi:unnamed protein product [Microthlaspi erraticum]|uniref:Uncharacterized protein n=1 Tax=Microthlaspi erraticum TaxID=1685480 RepID=A0A6D2JTI0_9BRAS|nr:unnamed protein product [Microthlaspi erraticum]
MVEWKQAERRRDREVTRSAAVHHHRVHLNPKQYMIYLQYFPSRLSVKILNAQLGQQILKWLTAKRLSKNIYELFFGTNMIGDNDSLLNRIPNSMTILLDMFGAFVEDKVRGNVNSCFVVTEQASWLRLIKFLDQQEHVGRYLQYWCCFFTGKVSLSNPLLS